MKYKLIISDYDGTLSDSGVMPQVVKDAIDRFRIAGGKFVICTGRPYYSIKNVVDTASLMIDALCSNQGTLIHIGDNLVKDSGLSGKLAASLVRDARVFNKDATAFSINAYYEGDSEAVKRYTGYHGQWTKTTKLDDLASFLENSNEVFGRVVIQKGVDEDVSAIKDYVHKKYNGKIITNSGSPTLIEMVSTDFNKYTGASFIANYFNIKESETITMGDSTNDLKLLEFGYSIAVANASEEVKKSAKKVVGDVKTYPIVNIINKILRGEDI